MAYVPRTVGGFELAALIADEAREGRHVLLAGPPGSGKSSAVFHALSAKQRIWIQVSNDLYPDDLVLKHLPIGDNLTTVNGVLLEACLKGKVLFLDELNAARASSLTPLHGPMSERRMIVQNCADPSAIVAELRKSRPRGVRAADDQIDCDGNTVTFTPRPGFAVVASVNPGAFGREGLGVPDAVRDRFSLIIRVGLTDGFVEAMGVNSRARRLLAWTQQNNFDWQPSLRSLLDFTHFAEQRSPSFAARALLGHVPDEHVEAMHGVLTSLVPGECSQLGTDAAKSSRAA